MSQHPRYYSDFSQTLDCYKFNNTHEKILASDWLKGVQLRFLNCTIQLRQLVRTVRMIGLKVTKVTTCRKSQNGGQFVK
jgi:hypothetical protein